MQLIHGQVVEKDIMEYKEVNLIKYMEPPLSSCFARSWKYQFYDYQNAASEFHIYKTIWTPTSVKIYVDDKLFHSVAKIIPTFNKDFFDFECCNGWDLWWSN
jgi:beta-glucanase (GH16 family)